MRWFGPILFMLLSVTPRASVAQPPLDGVYWPDGGGTLMITGQQVWASPPHRWAPPKSLRSSGTLRADDTHLHIKLPERPAIRATWAVIHGELWLNVLRPTAKANVWTAALTGWPSRVSELTWHRPRGRMVFTTPDQTLTFTGVTTLAIPINGEVGMLPKYREADANTQQKASQLRPCQSHGDGAVLCAGGLLLTSPKAKVTHDETLRRFAWRQYGEAILTPWSVRMGPINMVPDRDAQLAPGTWTGPRVDPSAPCPLQSSTTLMRATERLTVSIQPVLPPFDERWRGLPGQHPLYIPLNAEQVHRPDSVGITVTAYGYDCQQGHADWLGSYAWFPLKDGRIFVHNTTPTHGIEPARASYILTRQ